MINDGMATGFRTMKGQENMFELGTRLPETGSASSTEKGNPNGHAVTSLEQHRRDKTAMHPAPDKNKVQHQVRRLAASPQLA